MREINVEQVSQFITIGNLQPCRECWWINQDSGDSEKIMIDDLRLDRIRNPVFKTDDNGRIKVVTLDIYYDYQNRDLYTGCIIRILFYRVNGNKRIQPHSNSNGVGAPRSNYGCNLYFINN